jgi:hypothetical protein
MATLYITEFADEGQSVRGAIQIAAEPVTAEQTISITASNAASDAFAETTIYVRIHTDAICSIAFGTTPVATAAKRRLAADQTEYFGVPVGQSYKIGVITNT